ncbi:protein Niban 1 isoform X2 [Electrophorus electricus]|uniref:protein Niban 1 isoform X2 n=1 Tax=Electrophorus electricus TaxID=8005 RepID=UPI0015CF964A|nr:protein Niban 1 isoform X2 [Electrophorus electricus]
MGVSSSSLLDESKSNYIRGRTEAELKNFSPHYRSQYSVAFFSQVQDEVEQQQTGQTQLLKQKEAGQALDVVYKDSVLHYDDSRKWKERFVVVRADYSLELHDNQESFTKGAPARHVLLPTGGTVLTSEDKYSALVDKAFPDLNSSKEEAPSPMVTVPGPFPVYLRLPYRRDSYFSFQQEEKQTRFVSVLSDCIRHQNGDYLKKTTCEVQAFLNAILFYRQEKGHYESWEMLVGRDVQVLANLVMEELLPSLQTELLPRLRGRKAERKRVWFATVEATYELVQEQLRVGLLALKEECSMAVKQKEGLIRSDMDQITSSCTFLKTKLQGLVSEPAMKFCSESIVPYLASILEELMGPVSSGFESVRQRLDAELTRVCRDFPSEGTPEELSKALAEVGHSQLEDCYQHVTVLKEQLQELRNRFKFSNSTLLVHSTQSHMQQLMENAVYTFEMLLQSAIKDKTDKLASVMEKAKIRVLKQYDYDSSTVRKKIFQDALVDITLPAIRRNLAPSCKTELQNYDQYIFADYTNFIQVENVYEDILLKILNDEVSKVVKEAASLKKNNLFVDSTELQCISQCSLNDSRTPPRSAPSSPASVLVSAAVTQRAEQNSPSPLVGNSCLESQPTQDGLVVLAEGRQEFTTESSQPTDAESTTPTDPLAMSQSGPAAPEVSSIKPEMTALKPDASVMDFPQPGCQALVDKPEVASSTNEATSPTHKATITAVGEVSSEAGSQSEATSPTHEAAVTAVGEVSSEAGSQSEATSPTHEAAMTAVGEVSSEAGTQSEAAASVVVSLQASPEITITEDPETPTEHRHATDRAIYLIPPAGVEVGSPVPLTEECDSEGKTEAQHISTPEDAITNAPSPSCSEFCKPETVSGSSPPEEACIGTALPNTTNAAEPLDSQMKDDIATPVQAAACSSAVPTDDSAASEALIQSVENTGTEKSIAVEFTPGLPILTDLPVGGSAPPETVPIESEGTLHCSGSPDQDTYTGDPEAEELMDSVKSIRDLVVEIIEVEDMVSPCPQ